MHHGQTLEVEDRFLSISEIARRIGMDRKTVVAMWQRGDIPIREFSPRKKGMFESSLRQWIGLGRAPSAPFCH